MKEPKIGETYYAVPCDHRSGNGKYITVESVGRKYFTANNMKFYKNSFLHFNGVYSADYKLYDSKEQYELKVKANKCWGSIRDRLYRVMTDEEIIELYDKLKDR
jgi:hypothetical protein